MLEMRDLKLHYGKVEALRGVTLKVEEGAVVGLLGANGAGKTSILRAISGLTDASSGEISFRGERIDHKSPDDVAKLGIAHVPQGRHLFPYMTVFENLMMGAFCRKDRLAVKADLDDLYDRFPVLQRRSRQKAGTLSGGEQQMVAVSRALMSKPKLVLMDEPSLGLSPLLVKMISEIITSVNATGITIMLVEQNSRVAMALASRCYVLQLGKIVFDGTSERLSGSDELIRGYLGVSSARVQQGAC